MTFDFDLFIIGAGSGGVRAARVAAQHGAKVAVSEEYRVGGTCVIRGCVPKKMLVYGAHFAEDLHEAARFGWDIEGASFNWPRLRDIVQDDVTRLEGLYTQTLNSNHATIFAERATIAGPNTVRLASGQEVTAKVILIAVGAWPSVPNVPGAEFGISSNEIFHLESLHGRHHGGYTESLHGQMLDKLLAKQDPQNMQALLQLLRWHPVSSLKFTPAEGAPRALRRALR